MSTSPGAFTGALATPHALATDAGLSAYRDGGSALDAAIAAAAVLTVVYPHNVALGGDMIALVRTPDGAVTCLNASGWAGAGAEVAAMRARHGTSLPVRGADSVTVPGGVRGWEALRGCGARLTWERTLRPAQDAAEFGVPVVSSLAAHVADPENADLWGTADFDRVFRPAGAALRAGDDLRQSALAETLGVLRERGPDCFYGGELADRTVGFLRSRGSALAASDFAQFQPETCEPIMVPFGELSVMTSPPNSQGFLLLRALLALEELEVNDPLGDGLGTLMRIFRRGNQLRDDALADPRHARPDVRTLIHGDLAALTELGGERAAIERTARGDTVGIAAADSDGYAVSLIQSVYYSFGSGLIDPDTGILFHNRGTSFSLDSAHPNVLAPRKRPAHTLMPTMTTHRGKLRHVLSTMGGQGQPQIIAQLLLHAAGGASAAAAVAAPRAVVGQQAGGATTASVVVEADLPCPARDSLARSGLVIMEVAPHTELLGHSNVVLATADGTMTAASDPRSDGSAGVVQYARPRSSTAATTTNADEGPRVTASGRHRARRPAGHRACAGGPASSSAPPHRSRPRPCRRVL